MALINCPECKNEISTKAQTCPKCGYILSTNDVTKALEKIRRQKVQEKKNQEKELEKKANKAKNNVLIFIFIFLAIIAVTAGSKYYNNFVVEQEQNRLEEVNRKTQQILPSYPVYSGGERVNKTGKIILGENEKYLSAWSTPYLKENRKEMMKLEYGDEVQIFRELSENYRVMNGGKIGWIPKDKIRITKTSNVVTESRSNQTRTVTITTIADGVNIGKVNLWDAKTARNRVVAKCTNGEKVELISKSGEFVKLRKSNGKEGWCLEGWVRY